MASKAVIDTLIAEAGGEGRKGLIAAAWALQQRAAARGMTLDQVVREPGQFEGYSNPGSGSRKAQQNSRLRAQVEEIVNGVQTGEIPNPVPYADHFVSGSANPSWAKDMRLVAEIGGHRFYASGDVPKSAVGASTSNSALNAIDRAAPVPQSAADLGALRSGYLPDGFTTDEGLAVRKVPTVDIDPFTGQPRFPAVPETRIGTLAPNEIDGIESQRVIPLDDPLSRLDSIGRGAKSFEDMQASMGLPARRPLPAPATNATIARTMASLAPQGEASSRITRLPSSMTEPRNLTTPILQGNGQVVDPAALTLWEDGTPDIGLASIADRQPLPAIPPLPTREATMAPSRVFVAPRKVETAAQSSFDQKYGDLVPLIARDPAPDPAGSLQRQVAYENAGAPQTMSAAPTAKASRPTVVELQAIRDVPAAPKASPPLPSPGIAKTAGLDLGTMPSLSELSDFANPPLGMALTFKTNTDRLQPDQFDDPPTRMRVGGVSANAVAPIPMPALSRTAVGSMLDVVPLPKATPTVPVPRQTSVAPIPMPRLDRPSSILPGIKLPGLLGVAQGISKAINNASGPFNNGVDNLLFQGMRGGNVSAPGAATARAGGYLYAPGPNGAWINVGRDTSFSSSGSSSGGGMSPVRGENRYDADTNSWSRK